jgi:cytochrome P450
MSGEAMPIGALIGAASSGPTRARVQFPLGAAVSLEDLTRDPYPIYAKLQAEEPVSWISALNMWYVTRYEDVRTILMDGDGFTTAWPNSLIFDTFGAQMLTTEGLEHDKYRRPVQPSFSPSHLRANLEAAIRDCCRALIEELRSGRTADLRSAFAARLPVQTILIAFGIPIDQESNIRRWYDSFEQALSNFAGSESVRSAAQKNVAECHEFLSGFMRQAAEEGGARTLLAKLVNAPCAGTAERCSNSSQHAYHHVRRNLNRRSVDPQLPMGAIHASGDIRSSPRGAKTHGTCRRGDLEMAQSRPIRYASCHPRRHVQGRAIQAR